MPFAGQGVGRGGGAVTRWAVCQSAQRPGVRGLSGPEGKTGPDGAGGGSGAQVGKVESARVVDQGDFQQLQPGQVHAGSCGQRALLSIRGPLVVAADVFRSEEHRGAAREAVVPSDLMGAGGQLRQLD